MAEAALGGSTPRVVTTGGDYACRERVFAPPNGTLDVDWVAAAVLDEHPELPQPLARAFVEDVWLQVRAAAHAQGVVAHEADLDDIPQGTTAEQSTARAVVLDAVRLFRVV